MNETPVFASAVQSAVRQGPEPRAEPSNEVELQIQAARVEERRIMAGELHDSVGQNLTALGLGLARLVKLAAPHAEMATVVQEMQASLQQACTEIRLLSFLLQPLDDEAFPAGIEAAIGDLASGFARRAGLRAALRIEPLRRPLCRERQLALHRIVQEALVNVHRHAHATAVSIELASRGGHVVLKVRDDGAGLAPAAAPGVGIASMRQRLRRLDGEMLIVSDEAGTTLTVKLPVEPAADAGRPL